MRRIIIGTLSVIALLWLAVPAQAQTNPCQASATVGVLNPTKIALESPDHNTTEADGSFRVTSYTAGMFLQGVDPATGTPVQTQSIPRASFTLVPGTVPSCYEATIPFASYPIGMTYIAASRVVGPGGMSAWSGPTNPFGKSAPPAPTGANRVR